MSYNLAALVKRKTPRAKTKALRAVSVPVVAQQELRSIYMEIINGWAAQINSRILPAYKEALPQSLNRDSLILVDDWWESVSLALGSASLILNALAQRSRARVTVWAVGLKQSYVDRWAKSILSQTKVDPTTYIDPNKLNGQQATATESVAASVEGLSQELGTKLSTAVWRGLANGKKLNEIETELNATVGVLARRILYYEKENTTKYVSGLERLLEEDASIAKYVWLHTPQKHPREYHVRRHGHVFSWAKPPWDGPPGTQPNCKCRARPVLALDVDPSISHIGQQKGKG